LFVLVEEPPGSILRARDTGFGPELGGKQGSYEVTPGEEPLKVIPGEGPREPTPKEGQNEMASSVRPHELTPQAGGPGTGNVLVAKFQRWERTPPRHFEVNKQMLKEFLRPFAKRTYRCDDNVHFLKIFIGVNNFM